MILDREQYPEIVFLNILLERYENANIYKFIDNEGNLIREKLSPVTRDWIWDGVDFNEDYEKVLCKEAFLWRLYNPSDMSLKKFDWMWFQRAPNFNREEMTEEEKQEYDEYLYEGDDIDDE